MLQELMISGISGGCREWLCSFLWHRTVRVAMPSVNSVLVSHSADDDVGLIWGLLLTLGPFYTYSYSEHVV